MINTLNPLQLELLKQFSYGLKKEEDLLAIKRIISQYLANNITKEMDRIWVENNYNEETLEAWLRADS
jgi:hypothetical protein